MQTFLPYPSLAASLQCLDYKRLGKQRVESMQILRTLLGEKSGWSHHPAVKMWEGHEDVLIHYYNLSLAAWEGRGYRNIILQPLPTNKQALIYPPWIGNHNFHLSHRSNLVRKFPEYYKKLWPDVPDDLPYVWPV